MTLTLLSGGTNGRTALRAESGGNVLQSRIRDHSDSEASPDVSNENLNIDLCDGPSLTRHIDSNKTSCDDQYNLHPHYVEHVSHQNTQNTENRTSYHQHVQQNTHKRDFKNTFKDNSNANTNLASEQSFYDDTYTMQGGSIPVNQNEVVKSGSNIKDFRTLMVIPPLSNDQRMTRKQIVSNESKIGQTEKIIEQNQSTISNQKSVDDDVNSGKNQGDKQNYRRVTSIEYEIHIMNVKILN